MNKTINLITKKLHLKILAGQKSGQKIFFIAKVQNKNNKKMLFKCNLDTNNETINKMRNEIFFHKQINNKDSEILHTPKYYNDGCLKNHYWLLREFINAPLAGSVHELRNKEINKNHINQIVDIILNQDKVLKNINLNKLNNINSKYYLNWLEHDINYVKFYNFSKKEIKTIEDIVKNFVKNIKKTDYIIGHGDINPKNILLNRDKIYLFDWERLSQTHIFDEVSFFWAASWTNEKLRKYFIKKIINNFKGDNRKEFILNLKAVLILRCLGEIRYWQTLPENIDYITDDKDSIFRTQKAINVHIKTLKKIIRNKYL